MNTIQLILLFILLILLILGGALLAVLIQLKEKINIPIAMITLAILGLSLLYIFS